MSSVYTNLMNSPYMKSLNASTPFKILFYNGDVSLKATTMEAEYFVESLASNLSAKVTIDRQRWLYHQPGKSGASKVAGYRKEFLFANQNVKIELATIAVCDFYGTKLRTLIISGSRNICRCRSSRTSLTALYLLR